MKRLTLLSAIMALSVGTALAQSENERLVVVDLEGIMPELSAGLSGNGTVPTSIEVPADVAAAACGVDSAALAAELAAGSASCTAVISSAELTQFVEEQMALGYATDPNTTSSTDDDSSDDDVIDDDDGSDDGDDTDGGDDTGGDDTTDGDTPG